MAKKNIIFQGFTKETHLNAFQRLFEVQDIKKVMVSVAFVSENGVSHIESNLRKYAACTTIFAGIRNDITSYQGLTKLHDLGCKLYTVDTGSRHILFHPKLYLVSGAKSARLLIGSANLTVGGLNNNIEAGMFLDLSLTNADDKIIVNEVESLLESLPEEYPEHIQLVGKPSILEEMLNTGRLVDEMFISAPKPVTSVHGGSNNDAVSRIKLKISALRSASKKPKAALKKQQPLTPIKVIKTKPVPVSIGVEYEMVWESKALTERDLNVPSRNNTHATGSINLDKGLLEGDVDQRHYFREIVFSSLSWTPTKSKSSSVEESYAKFQLVLKGISYGEFDLRIAHSTDKESKTYKQNNAMTRLSWGSMKEYVSKPDLIGRSLTLYRDKGDPTRFVLEID